MEMPFSYSAVEKTFYSFFIFSGMLDTPFNHRLEEGQNPRTLEIEQIVELMNIVAETIYVGKFEHSRGIRRIENDGTTKKGCAGRPLAGIPNGERGSLAHLVTVCKSAGAPVFHYNRETASGE